ncbi:unnamed protein product [Peniophora sp. CBMAI 1063]|nr:unnamed protein product [Peniophora sp. CBMAI 1063]
MAGLCALGLATTVSHLPCPKPASENTNCARGAPTHLPPRNPTTRPTLSLTLISDSSGLGTMPKAISRASSGISKRYISLLIPYYRPDDVISDSSQPFASTTAIFSWY